MTTVRRTAVVLGLVALLAGLVAAPSGAAPQWAPAATAAIRPGVQTDTHALGTVQFNGNQLPLALRLPL